MAGLIFNFLALSGCLLLAYILEGRLPWVKRDAVINLNDNPKADKSDNDHYGY